MRKRVIKRLIYIFRWRYDDSKLHKLIDTNDPMDIPLTLSFWIESEHILQRRLS